MAFGYIKGNRADEWDVLLIKPLFKWPQIQKDRELLVKLAWMYLPPRYKLLFQDSSVLLAP